MFFFLIMHAHNLKVQCVNILFLLRKATSIVVPSTYENLAVFGTPTYCYVINSEKVEAIDEDNEVDRNTSKYNGKQNSAEQPINH